MSCSDSFCFSASTIWIFLAISVILLSLDTEHFNIVLLLLSLIPTAIFYSISLSIANDSSLALPEFASSKFAAASSMHFILKTTYCFLKIHLDICSTVRFGCAPRWYARQTSFPNVNFYIINFLDCFCVKSTFAVIIFYMLPFVFEFFRVLWQNMTIWSILKSFFAYVCRGSKNEGIITVSTIILVYYCKCCNLIGHL